MDKRVGHYSFIIGVIIAVILGLPFLPVGAAAPWLVSLLVILGLVVGFLNVAGKETREFLLVSAVLIIAAGMGNAGAMLSEVGPGATSVIGSILGGIFTNLLSFIVPATVVVGLKDILALSKST